MHAIAFVFVLLLGAAGLWYGGRSLLARRKGPPWLARALDQRGQLLLAVALLPILVLISLGFSALLLSLR